VLNIIFPNGSLHIFVVNVIHPFSLTRWTYSLHLALVPFKHWHGLTDHLQRFLFFFRTICAGVLVLKEFDIASSLCKRFRKKQAKALFLQAKYFLPKDFFHWVEINHPSTTTCDQSQVVNRTVRLLLITQPRCADFFLVLHPVTHSSKPSPKVISGL